MMVFKFLLRAPLTAAREMTRKLSERELTFGLPEALVLSLLGIAVALAAAYYYTRVGGPSGHG